MGGKRMKKQKENRSKNSRQNSQKRQNARKEEAKRLTESAKVFENRVKALKSNLFNSMKATGKTKFATDLFSINIAKNGGKQTLTIDGDVPEEYTKTITENDTDKIRQALEKGEKFEDLAKKYSTDKDTASNGGSLGYINSDDMDASFWNSLKDLKKGENCML